MKKSMTKVAVVILALYLGAQANASFVVMVILAYLLCKFL